MPEPRTVGESAAAAGFSLSPLVDRARDEAALTSMAWTVARLAEARPAEAPDSADITASHRPIVRRWIEELTSAGWISAEPEPRWVRSPPVRHDVEEAWKHAIALAPKLGEGGALTRFFAECSYHLLALLAGKAQVQSLLFDDEHIATEIYQANEASRYTNAAAAVMIRERCLTVQRAGRNPCLLEVGGGVGGTTDIVLDELRDLPLRFHFTDVGEWFVSRAVERWAGRAGLSAGIFDVNFPECRQQEALGEIAGLIDVVLAANVMHNAVDLPRALQSLSRLCRPEAELVLVETGTEHLPLLISMRFLMTLPPPGPGIGGDRAQHGRMLLDSGQWTEAINTSGWNVIEVLPGRDSNHSVARYDQHVWRAIRTSKEQPHERFR